MTQRFVVWWNPHTRTLGGLGWRIYGTYDTRAEAEAHIARVRKHDPYAEWEISAAPGDDTSEPMGGQSFGGH